MTLLLALVSAHGAELSFSPDRPGVGDSTGTPGVGHAMIEGGVAVGTAGSVAAQTSGIVGRLGVDEGLELRLRVPDVVFTDPVGTGSVGLGFKVGGSVGSRWSASVVPEVFAETADGSLGGSVGANLAVAEGPLGAWGHASVVGTGAGTGALAGGGISVAAGPGGFIVHSGFSFGGSAFAGPGAWWAVSERVQVDAGVDFNFVGAEVQAVVLLGSSVGF